MPITDFAVATTEIPGLLVLTPKQVSDERGVVRELFREHVYAELGIGRFAQVNLTFTGRGAIRGLHGEQMTKVVTVAAGEAFGAYVDARAQSSSFGRVETVRLVPGVQVVVPSGVLNGFQSVSDGGCEYLYGFDVEWRVDMPGIGVTPLDDDLGIGWPISVDPDDRSLLSAKDAALPRFADLAR